jgi:feruloyl esterase
MEFGIGHPEKIVDWAYRSVHEMTTVAKTVVERTNGRAPARSYFSGCSTGGQQALSEAKRHPGVAHYKGAGSIDDAANFSCAARQH